MCPIFPLLDDLSFHDNRWHAMPLLLLTSAASSEVVKLCMHAYLYLPLAFSCTVSVDLHTLC